MAVIYKITNLINGHAYIGVTKYTAINRWKQHVYASKRPDEYKSRLIPAIRKYGADNFSITEVASCLSNPGAVEQDVIQSFQPEYNVTCGGEFTQGRRTPHTPETIERMAVANTGKKRSAMARENISLGKKKMFLDKPEVRAACVSRILDAGKLIDREKQRAAVSISSKNRVWSDESRAKLSASTMGRTYPKEVIDRGARKKDKPVECIELATVFDSILEAGEMLGIHYSTISKVCLGKLKSAHKMHFQFV